MSLIADGSLPRGISGALACGLSVWLFVALPGVSAAQEEPVARAVLVSLESCCPSASFSSGEARLVRELEILDVDVVVVAGQATRERAQRREFARLSRRHRADISIRLSRARHLPGIQLWMSEAGSADLTSRYLSVGDLDGAGAAQIVGLKAVEALVGCRHDLRLDQYTTAQPVGDGEDLEGEGGDGVEGASGPERNPPSRFRIDLGPALAGSPGGVGPRGGLQLALTWSLASALSIRATGLVSLLGADLETDFASSSFRLGLVRGYWVWHFVRHGPVRVAASLGGGLAIVGAEGTSVTHEARDDSTAAGVVGAGLEMSLVPTRHLGFRFGIGADVLVPEVIVQFDGEPVAEFGRPFVEASASLVLRLP